MIRCRAEQNIINAETDRRLLEFQSPKEIVFATKASSSQVAHRSRVLKLNLYRITDEERDHLLVRRKSKGATP